MALFPTRVPAFSSFRDITITPTGAFNIDAWKAILGVIMDYEQRVDLGEVIPNIALPGVTVVVPGKHPFIVYRFTAFTADFVAGIYAFTYDTSAPNNESLP